MNAELKELIKKIAPQSALYFYSVARKQSNIFVKGSNTILPFLSKRFLPNHKIIELDITADCNLHCPNCNHSCGQAPSKERMTVKQIKRFVKETFEKNKEWEMIKLIGGEPTLHPDFFEITNELQELRKEFPKTKIMLVTNGFGEETRQTIAKLPDYVIVSNSKKLSPINNFEEFNMAPVDDAILKFSDFSRACPIPKNCGIALTRYGYYPCSCAGPIDRVFGFDIGRKKMPEEHEKMQDELKALCKYCGHYRETPWRLWSSEEKISKSWKKAYEEYKRHKPELTLY